ncbi:MAG: GAF domain-containing protein [Gemmatimonadetes bacterium]|nr:GAF domain-containing protein [Gemmatimonadota bacterium]
MSAAGRAAHQQPGLRLSSRRARRGLLAGALFYLASLLLSPWLPGPVIAGAGLLAAGVLAYGGWRAGRLAAERGEALRRIREEAARGREGGEEVRASRRLNELEAALERVRRNAGASRAILWEIDEENARALPRLVAGTANPPPVALAGDPLGWAWSERLPLRLEAPPRWAAEAARAWVRPLDAAGTRYALFTLEYAGEALPGSGALEDAASFLEAFVRMQGREALAAAAHEQLERVLEVLRRLPRETDALAFTRELAEAACRLIGGTGAAVAVWHDEAGEVLAVAGRDGGPAPGAPFGARGSEFALAARGVTPLVRENRKLGDELPVVAEGERWLARPRSLAVIPLLEGAQGVVGVLGVWSAEAPRLDAHALEVLEALGPYAAFHLRQARLAAAQAAVAPPQPGPAAPRRWLSGE